MENRPVIKDKITNTLGVNLNRDQIRELRYFVNHFHLVDFGDDLGSPEVQERILREALHWGWRPDMPSFGDIHQTEEDLLSAEQRFRQSQLDFLNDPRTRDAIGEAEYHRVLERLNATSGVRNVSTRRRR